MNTRYIRAMLRAATAAGYLSGWEGPDVRERFTLAPAIGPARETDLTGAVAYVTLLQLDGLEPVYRRGEPADF